ncbi:hypothetical protein MTO96_052267 [Rhipicephalus appendiculatus]
MRRNPAKSKSSAHPCQPALPVTDQPQVQLKPGIVGATCVFITALHRHVTDQLVIRPPPFIYSDASWDSTTLRAAVAADGSSEHRLNYLLAYAQKPRAVEVIRASMPACIARD